MLRPTLLALLLPGLACGPTGSDDTGDPPATSAATSTGEGPGTTATPTSTTSDTSDPSDTSDTSDPSATSSGEPPTTDPVSTTDATTGPLATTTDATGSTGEPGDTSDTGDTGTNDVGFAAQYWAGGLDHLTVFKADFANDLCTTLHFAAPMQPAPEFPILAPESWALSWSVRSPGTVGCLEGMSEVPGDSAVAGVGEVAWEALPMLICPAQLDIDVTMTFPDGDEVVQAIGVPVEGCS